MSAWIYPIAPGDELTAVDRQMLVASGEEHGVKVYDQAPAPAKDGGDQRWLTPEIRMEKVHTHLEGICVPETRCISNHERRKTSRARRSSRYSETHNLTEKRRRCRINEKLKTLQQLVPGCDKSNQASTLDKTIRYMKSLQQHLQVDRFSHISAHSSYFYIGFT
uniref:BHLH domain-containing protein n=1 Tax=Leersia perrieri TaxID=77586 RepID=A0A0D9Y152_9ORYZ